jgi:hypothetical protein
MRITLGDRFRAAWNAFQDPAVAWEGYRIRQAAYQMRQLDTVGILRGHEEVGYVIEVPPYRVAARIRALLEP